MTQNITRVLKNSLLFHRRHVLLRKLRHRGILKVGWIFTFIAAAYNLVRLRNLDRDSIPAV